MFIPAMEMQKALQFCSQQQRKNSVQGYQILAKSKPFHLNDSLEIFLAEIWGEKKNEFWKYTMDNMDQVLCWNKQLFHC